LRKLKYARGNAGQLEKELEEVREERDRLRRMLGVIQEYIKEGL
jgi:hypothetical protein